MGLISGKGFGCLPSLALKSDLQLPDVRMGCGEEHGSLPQDSLQSFHCWNQQAGCPLWGCRREATLAGEVFGSFPGLTPEPGTQVPDVCDVCSGIFQACQGIV